MSQYRKLIGQVIATALTFLIAALVDGEISPSEWMGIAIGISSAALVFAAPNIPGAQYTKLAIAAVLAALNILVTVVAACSTFTGCVITTSDKFRIGVAVLGAVGVYAVPNDSPDAARARARASGGSVLPMLLIGVLFLAGCDTLLTGFRAGFAASKPFIQSLVTSGVLTQGAADTAVADINDGVTSATQGERCIKAITVTGHLRKVEKAKCYYQAAQDLRAILDRHNLTGNDLLDRISMIASGAIEAFETYYTVVNTPREIVGPSGGIIATGAEGIKDENADKQLEATLKDLNKQLKALSQP